MVNPPAGIDLFRLVAVEEFVSRGLPVEVAARAALAMHPLDDVAEPGREFENRVRRESAEVSAGLRGATAAQAAEIAAKALASYRRSAVELNEPYYQTRYDKALTVIDPPAQHDEGPVDAQTQQPCAEVAGSAALQSAIKETANISLIDGTHHYLLESARTVVKSYAGRRAARALSGRPRGAPFMGAVSVLVCFGPRFPKAAKALGVQPRETGPMLVRIACSQWASTADDSWRSPYETALDWLDGLDGDKYASLMGAQKIVGEGISGFSNDYWRAASPLILAEALRATQSYFANQILPKIDWTPVDAPLIKVNAEWRADPTGRHELRYWSGSKWTEHVMDAGNAGIDPLPTTSAGRWAPDPTGRHQWRLWTGTKWADEVNDAGVVSLDPPLLSPPSD